MTGIETILLTNAAGALAKQAVSILSESGKGLFGSFGNKVSQTTQQLIFDASRKYVQSYTERHGILKVLGMPEPVKLENVYTTVQLLDSSGIRSFESTEKLEKAFREQGRKFRVFEETEKRSGVTIANERQYLMVLGAPGSGKTTFLRKIGLEALKGKKISRFEHQCIPVLIELKRLTASKIDLQKIIAQEFEICGFPGAGQFTLKALQKGRLLILLDGLDEVPTANLNQAVAKIQDFVDRYDENRYITSCRTAAYRRDFRRFSDVAIADFDDIQIQQFINNWFQSENDRKVKTAEHCWELLQRLENKAAKELAHTPLLLTFLCLVYDRAQNFPSNRSALYRKALRILLEEWAAEKRILREEIYQGLNTELEEVLLSEIAYKGFTVDRLFFPQAEIVEQIKTFLANSLNAPQHVGGKSVLDAISVQQGILVERAEDVFSFSHLTLQEYLTAYHINEDYDLLEQLVDQHLTDHRWREVFLMVAGLPAKADKQLTLMDTATRSLVNHPKLQTLLDWADQVSRGLEKDYSPTIKRAVAIYYILAHAQARNFNLAYTLVRALGLNLDRTRVRSHISTLNRARDRARAEARTHTLDRGFDRALACTFTLDRGQTLPNYLYACELMIRCKESAVHVSRNIWETIEERMLMPNLSTGRIE